MSNPATSFSVKSSEIRRKASTTYQLTDRQPPASTLPPVDETAFNRLTSRKTINWCRTAQFLFPLQIHSLSDRTLADSSPITYLFESVLVYICGTCDPHEIRELRQSCKNTMESAWSVTSVLGERWQAERDVMGSPLSDSTTSPTAEWSEVCAAFSSRSTVDVETIHVFVLSNVICRPIVILSDSQQSHDISSTRTLHGIFLPLLHDVSVVSCRHPVVIYANCDHESGKTFFQPLVSSRQSTPTPASRESGSVALIPMARQALPLVGHDLSPLPVRCCLPSESLLAEDYIVKYLELVELPYTTTRGINLIRCAQLGNKSPDISPKQGNHEGIRDPVPRDVNEGTRCIRPECRRFALQEFQGLCLICYQKRAETSSSSEQKSGNATTVAVTASAIPSSTFSPRMLDDYNVLGTSQQSTSAKKCLATGCELYGSSTFGGYCSQHFKVVKRVEPSRNTSAAQIRSPKRSELLPTGSGRNFFAGYQLSNTVEEVSTEMPHKSSGYYCTAPTPVAELSHNFHGEVVSRLCRNRSCDRFGDIAYDGLCSSCWTGRQHGINT